MGACCSTPVKDVAFESKEVEQKSDDNAQCKPTSHEIDRAKNTVWPDLFDDLGAFAIVYKVYDGDTLTCLWPCGMQPGRPASYVRIKVRLNGIDTPELKSSNPAEKARAQMARDVLSEWCQSSGNIVWLQTAPTKATAKAKLACAGRDMYGRVLGTLYPSKPVVGEPYPQSAQEFLLQHKDHLAKPYDGGTKSDWNEV